MTNPTTYFGWQMPEPTDLVTDLPADFEVFGQAVDTDLHELLGGTTGQLLSKTSATDLDFTWVTPNAGDITGVTAGTGISGGGSSGDVTVTNSMATAIDAKGDLIVGTGNDSFSRLAVGATNGQVLTVDSAEATGLKYAALVSGGMTLLSTTTLSGASTAITGIDQTYKNLQIVIKNVDNAATTGTLYCSVRINGDATANRHISLGGELAEFRGYNFNATSWPLIIESNITTLQSLIVIDIFDYTNATTRKFGRVLSSANSETNSGQLNASITNSFYNQIDAITSLTFLPIVSTFTGGTVLIYGVK